MERYRQILMIALEAVFANRFRSLLTTLGIIFGVAAVIAMMAIGRGAQKEILDQIKLVGVNNIVIVPITDESKGNQKEENEGKGQSERFSPGLNLKDVESIRSIVPSVDKISPEVTYKTFIIKDGIRREATLTGVDPDYFNIFNLDIEKGVSFSVQEMRSGKPVCIIGANMKAKFFPKEDPVGKYIKCGNLWLKVIGVLQNRSVSESSVENLSISDYNTTIYAPLSTVLLRYKDRSAITADLLYGSESSFFFDGGGFMFSSSGSEEQEDKNINQVDKIVVQVKESEFITPTVDLLKKMLQRRHSGIEDFEIKVPELLLKQEQRTKDIFNIVLGAIAGISLLVGGIGIMNIMLASVMERIREIGIRRATGAKKTDITLQFLAEAVMLSVTGGLIGILLGVILAKLIQEIAGILTIISPISIIISFFVSATVGIMFGYMPAKKASEQDPVVSLRHD